MTTYLPSLTLPRVVFEQPAVSVLLPVVCGMGVGYSLKPDNTEATYRTLKQPPLSPPAYVFGPVWTVLYASMGYAAYRAWNAGVNSFDPTIEAAAKHGATLYTLQLGLNLIWSPLFFGLGRPVEASITIVTLTGVTGYLTYLWSQVDEVAGWLLAPYLGWLSFATYLCLGTGYLNNWNFDGKLAKTE